MDPLETFKQAQKEGWAHFAPLEMATTVPAFRLVKYSGIRAGQRVLDVACGTGVADARNEKLRRGIVPKHARRS